MTAEPILIVDDEESILSQLKWGLADEYQVFTAASAEQARQLLRERKPEVVTLDITLTPRGARSIDRPSEKFRTQALCALYGPR